MAQGAARCYSTCVLDPELGRTEPIHRNLELLIEYSGATFAGWQVQPNQRTAMGEIERAIARITQETVRVVAASRTDSGVHAYGQVCSFRTRSTLTTAKLWAGLNGVLPDEIGVRRVREVPDSFHARFSARGKHYRYQIFNRATRSPILAPTAWHVPEDLDLSAMQRAATFFEGEHDFSSLATKGPGGDRDDSCVRRLHAVRVGQSKNLLTVNVVGDAFLYKMVRTIVGTLVLVGQGKQPPEWVAAAIAAKRREDAGPTAPAHGLFLVRVFYEGDEFDRESVGRYLEGIELEHNDYRPRHAGPRQREGVRRAKSTEARALLRVATKD
jgi:tRNA pseudouridine38-40 synthase